MTGTSLDGLDVALAEIHGTGLEMKTAFRGMVSIPLGDLADALRHFAEGRPAAPVDYLRAARRLGELHADAVEVLCKTHLHRHHNLPEGPASSVAGSERPSPKLDFIVAHGQTIWHAPAEHLSWQLFDPWPLVRRLQVPVCHDLRQADLIAGGQGAPISPIADRVMYGPKKGIVNLGGICNISDTADDVGDINGGDVYPCNILIDGVIRLLYPSARFDKDGAIAASGCVRPAVVKALHESIRGAMVGKASLGREDFGEASLRRLVSEISRGNESRDIVASAVEAVAQQVAWFALASGLDELVLAGGGAKNPVLVDRIRRNCGHTSPANIVRSDDLGMPCEAREAFAFAILGALARDGVRITFPRVTGSVNPGTAGAWVYP